MDGLYDAPTMNSATVQPRTRDFTTSLVINLLGVIGFALAAGLASHAKIYLANTPVPITLQSTVVLLAGLTLGSRLGMASMLLYLALGAAGAQMFALQNETMEGLGWKYFWGPTGGYLVGFLLAQPLVGYLSRTRQFTGAFWGTLAGTGVIFAVGLLWLGIWLNQGLSETIEMGLLPFLVPGLIKTMVVLGIAPLALSHARPIFCGQPEDTTVS